MRYTMNTPESVTAPAVMTWLKGFGAVASGACWPLPPGVARAVSWRMGLRAGAEWAGAWAWEHASRPRTPNVRETGSGRIGRYPGYGRAGRLGRAEQSV